MAGIRYQRGDIFNADTQVIVNTVNCQGVMGKGLALAFKQRYPDMFTVYQEECKMGKLRIGRPSLYKESTPWILNFPTKDKWKANSRLEYLEKGLKYFAANCKRAGIKSIAFPKLGAQNGKLSWEDVGPLMARYLDKLDIDVYIYITEGDQEYYNDALRECKAAAWRKLNEAALSLSSLQQEVGLSLKEAKKVFEKRAAVEYLSQTDINSIEGLARISLERIKKYIQNHQFTSTELPGITCQVTPQAKVKKKVTSSKRKRENIQNHAEPIKTPLFTSQEIAI